MSFFINTKMHGRRNRGAKRVHAPTFHKFVCKVPLFSLHSAVFACEGAPICMCHLHFLNASYVPAKVFTFFSLHLEFILENIGFHKKIKEKWCLLVKIQGNFFVKKLI